MRLPIALTATVLGTLIAQPAFAGKEPTTFTPGHLFVGTEEGTIVELDPAGDVVQVFEVADEDTEVRGLVFGPGGLLYASLSSGEVVPVDHEGDVDDEVLQLSGTVGGGLVFGADGRLFAAESNGLAQATTEAQIEDVNLDTVNEATVAGLGFGPGGHLFVVGNESNSNTRRNSIFEFDGAREYLRRIELSSAFDPDVGQLAIAGSGDVYAAVPFEGHVAKVEFEGDGYSFETIGEGDLTSPRGVAVGPDGLIYVMDEEEGEIFVFDPDGDLVDAFGDDDFEDGVCLAFAPWRFRVAITGELTTEDDPTQKLKVKVAWLTLAPGSGTIGVELGEDEALADELETTALVFHGFEIVADAEADKRRAFQGTAVQQPALELGLGHVLLTVTGKVDADGRFVPKKAKGHVARTSSELSFLGTLKSRKLVQ